MWDSLGNLGDLFIKLGKWDEAEQNLLESIRLCTSLLPTRATASFQVLKFWLYSQQSKHELAQKMLEEGEPMVVKSLNMWKFMQEGKNLTQNGAVRLSQRSL